MICPEIQEPEVQELIENEGSIISIDTQEILNLVELEKLSSEEILEVRTKLGTYQAYVQLKRLYYGTQGCQVNLYRFVIVSYEDLRNRRSTGQ